MLDPFAVLGVPADATPETVRAAFRTRAKLLHPDKHSASSEEIRRASHEAFVQLQQAMDEALRILASPRRGAWQEPEVDPERPTELDPLLLLLEVPASTDVEWSASEIRHWSDKVVDKARGNVARANRLAYAAGARGEELAWATTHVLVTLYFEFEPGVWPKGAKQSFIYNHLNRHVTPEVRSRLPGGATKEEKTAASGPGFEGFFFFLLWIAALVVNHEWLLGLLP